MWQRIKWAWEVLRGRAWGCPLVDQPRLWFMNKDGLNEIRMSKQCDPKSWMDV
jgi:hypothetical protein